MKIDYRSQLDPKEQERLDNEWAEVFEESISRLARSVPKKFEHLALNILKELSPEQVDLVIEQLRTDKLLNQTKSDEEETTSGENP